MMLALLMISSLFGVFLIFRNWPVVEWAVLGIVAIVTIGAMMNLLYAIVCMERGYKTEEELARRQRKHWHPPPESLKPLRHFGMLRHR